MHIGLQVPSFTWQAGAAGIRDQLKRIGVAADEAGFASLWVMDHFFQIRGVGEADEPMLEAYATLSYLAAVTERVRLGALVTGVVYRHPGILIKTATTLDVLSGGRSYLGIGAAWFEREAVGLGVPFPSLSERFERLEETLQIAHQMWSGDIAPYEGQHYRLAEAMNHPQPVQKPRPRIMIGGMGERKTFRLVAQYGDACNLFAGMGLETLRHKLDVLRQRCDEVGRDYAEIEKTSLSTVHISPGHMHAQDVIELCRSLAEIGIQHAIFNMPNVQEITPLEIFGREIIPIVSEFGNVST